jgi:hypothetical protein
MQTATQNPKINIPVLKAWRRVFELIECIHDHPYDREGFQYAVLDLYGGDKSSKSVFRGMTIPTLRNLGLIVGYGDNIHESANGALLYAANAAGQLDRMRALRAILIEIDNENIGVSSDLLTEQSTFALEDFVKRWMPKVNITDNRTISNPIAQARAARERVLDWINFLTFAELLYNQHDNLRIDIEKFSQAKQDLDYQIAEKKENFKTFLFSGYKKIVFEQQGMGTVEIENLRTEVALSFHKKLNVILTEKQFDALLSDLPKTSDNHIISLGRSMGADEKLFFFQGKYYQTLLIRISLER